MVLVNIKKIKFYSSRERKEENDYRVVTQLRIKLSKFKRTHLSDQIKNLRIFKCQDKHSKFILIF